MTWPYHFSFIFLIVARRHLYWLVVCLMVLDTLSFMMWSNQEMRDLVWHIRAAAWVLGRSSVLILDLHACSRKEMPWACGSFVIRNTVYLSADSCHLWWCQVMSVILLETVESLRRPGPSVCLHPCSAIWERWCLVDKTSEPWQYHTFFCLLPDYKSLFYSSYSFGSIESRVPHFLRQ